MSNLERPVHDPRVAQEVFSFYRGQAIDYIKNKAQEVSMSDPKTAREMLGLVSDVEAERLSPEQAVKDADYMFDVRATDSSM
jgi:hypothetical protein